MASSTDGVIDDPAGGLNRQDNVKGQHPHGVRGDDMNEPQFESIPDGGLRVRAPAKINLSLLIAGRRADGYHAIETVMAKITLHDILEMTPTHGGGLELTCDGPYAVDPGPDNLVARAWRAVCDHVGSHLNVHIHLRKNAPVGAGLGGGSSNAAATVLGLDRLFGLGLAADERLGLAAELGSDVAFFLDGPLALCTGRGENVRPLDVEFPFRALLLTPNITVSTRAVYENYRHDAGLYERASTMMRDLIAKKKIASLAHLCTNMLESSCFALYGELARLKSDVEALGVRPVCLSGSGSAMYCLSCGTGSDLERAQSRIREHLGCKSVIVGNNRW